MFDYRLYRDADRAAIQQLWEQETGWGPLTERHWQRWYEENSYGPPVVVVATSSNGEVVGQFVFLASLVSIRGRIVRACRAFAPVVRKDLRLFGGHDFRSHPSFGMFERGSREMRDRGAALVYMLPDVKWFRVLKNLGFQCTKLPMWQFSLPLPARLPVAADYAIGELSQSADEIDALWEAAAQQHECIVVRDSNTLAWRSASDQVLAVTRGRRLVAIITLRKEGRKKVQWMLRDLLFAGDDATLRNVLALTCNLAHDEAFDPTRPVAKIVTVVSRALEKGLCNLGFSPANYDYPLAVQVMDASVAEDDVAPERWFVTGND